MRHFKNISVSLIILLCLKSNAQTKLNGLWGLATRNESFPEIFLRFKNDTFEFTDHRTGDTKFGKGTYKLDEQKLQLNYSTIPYQKSFVISYHDLPTMSAKRIMLRVFIYDGFEKKAAYKPTIYLIDSSGKDLIEIQADTSGKIITTIEDPKLIKKVKVAIGFGYDNSPEFNLTNYDGNNIYLQFFINFEKKNYKSELTETYHYKKTRMGDIILTDEKGKEFIFNEMNWRYSL